MLSGAGGDELFGGYYRHYRSKHDRLAGSFNWLQSVMHKNITNLLPLGVQQYAFTATNSVGFSHGISTSGINLGVLNQLLANSKLSSDTFDLLNEQLDELKIDFNAGIPKTEIAKKYGITRSYVYQLVR